MYIEVCSRRYRLEYLLFIIYYLFSPPLQDLKRVLYTIVRIYLIHYCIVLSLNRLVLVINNGFMYK